MQVQPDKSHERLVRAAIAAGHAADAQSYVQSLIDDAAADRWVSHHQAKVESLLRDRMQQPGDERAPGDFESLRKDVEGIVEQRQRRRAV